MTKKPSFDLPLLFERRTYLYNKYDVLYTVMQIINVIILLRFLFKPTISSSPSNGYNIIIRLMKIHKYIPRMGMTT